MFISTSKPIADSPVIPILLGGECRWVKQWNRFDELQGIVGWGAKASGLYAEALAKSKRLPCWHLEDGFLRSYLPGAENTGLSLVVDKRGIYYDATRTSDLEEMLSSDFDLLHGLDGDVDHAIGLIKEYELSKYNHAPPFENFLLQDSGEFNVLVVDQTYGDVSVERGLANDSTFQHMLRAALVENPNATIYIKTHPEVSNGSKQGYLSDWPEHPRVVMLREAANPLSLLKHMDQVYVVSSTLGFEALLAGKPVTVFGMPWYAGWGVTDDRQSCERRQRRRSIKELFAAAYLHYTRYLNPETHRPGTIFDVINWLVRQKTEEAKVEGRIIAIGLSKWKVESVTPVLSLTPGRVKFVSSVREAEELVVDSGDILIAWGRNAPDGIDELAARKGAARWSLEDGFIRSVGLGAHKIPPLSLVLDAEGIYFDPSQSSTLERILTTTTFSKNECERAREVRELIIKNRITKYNIEPNELPVWRDQDREIVFVPGQVEDDASIRYGTTSVGSNLELLKAARAAHTDAFIVYKPHPDVLYAGREGKLIGAERWADHIETTCSVVSCLEHCDIVHTMTSLSGFEALLRGKRVVTYGEPFYAGWGLTDDRVINCKGLHRRQRELSLDELVAGVLLRYPRYWDPVLKGYTTCEAVLNRIIEQRNREAGMTVNAHGLRLAVAIISGLKKPTRKLVRTAGPSALLRALLMWVRR